jgi:serine/threonine-protein kinase
LLKARQKLGKFRIKRRLSNGPIAAVYEARDTIQDRPVALKIPHKESMTDFFMQDFMREARLAERLEHPNILSIRDASYVGDHFVISMPLGRETLTQRMRRRLSTEVALCFVEQMVSAVAHAHRAKVIHCDIKPDNFIVFDDNLVQLTDFGFSKVAQRTVKASGSGTVGYIAPEQAVGRPMFQSDVFSLGLVIYEMLTGYLPEWPYDWPPPGIKRLKAKLSPKLGDWLRRSIAVRPEHRYKNANVMYREFKRLANGNGKKRRAKAKRRQTDDPAAWQAVLFKEFQRKYKKALDTRHHCSHCSGPIAETMLACPWCGVDTKPKPQELSYPAHCPRCNRGSKLDWKYCAWCYGPAFEVETTRHFDDKRYTSRCQNTKCKGELMPFMRYCPWCRTKVQRAWKLPGSDSRCKGCGWGVDTNYWHHCPWCARQLAQ